MPQKTEEPRPEVGGSTTGEAAVQVEERAASGISTGRYPHPASHSNGRKDSIRACSFPYMRQIALQSTRIPLILRAVSMLHCLRSAVELENFLGHQSAACHWSSEPGSVGGSGPLEASRPLPGNELSSRRRSPWQPISKGPEDPAS